MSIAPITPDQVISCKTFPAAVINTWNTMIAGFMIGTGNTEQKHSRN
jgi:hypothetical protein